MIYNLTIKFYHLKLLLVSILITCLSELSFQIPIQGLTSNITYKSFPYKFDRNFKYKLTNILDKNDGSNRTDSKNPFDAFFLSLRDNDKTGELKHQETSHYNMKKERKDFEIVNQSYNSRIKSSGNRVGGGFDWGSHFKLINNAEIDFLNLRNNNVDSENYITQSFLGFFNNIRKQEVEVKKKESKRSFFKEIVVPQLMSSINNDELEGAARGILMNEILLNTDIGKAVIPNYRPDGLPSMLFIGIENDIMPLHVSYRKEVDKFMFRTFPDFSPPDIPKVAGQRLKEWVIVRYKQIYDSVVEKSSNNKEDYNLLNSLNKYGIFFGIEFKDDVVCYLSEVTLYGSIFNKKAGKINYISRVSRILFSRLRPFIPLMSTFIPLQISEFRSLSFIGSPILMLRADSEDDILTQQALYYWSFESEKILHNYNRKDHVCNERELYRNSEYKQLCIIHPKDKNPRDPNTFNNGYLTTVSCFGLYPIGTMALFIQNSLYSLRICQENGRWSDTKILSDRDRAIIILHKCHSRNSRKESFYSRVSGISFFENF